MIYLDNAATTWPKPESVYKEMDHYIRNFGANPGRAGHKMAREAGKKIYEVREKLAVFFSADDSSEIVFTTSATHSLNLAIQGILKRGDHVITSSMEHNSVIRPLKELENLGLIDISLIKLNQSGELDLNHLGSCIRRSTKLIIISHGSNVTGKIFSLRKIGEIAKANKIFFMVDAAQTAGFFPIDLQELKIDLLAFPGHKSLYGPPGTGGLYIRSGIKVRPIFAGGTGSKSEELYQPQTVPDKFESGTMNSVGIIGLGAGVDFISKEGINQIREHELDLCHNFIEGLLNINNVKIYGPTLDLLRAPVVSFNIGNEDSSEVGYVLDQSFSIAVRSGIHCAPLAHQTLGTLQQGAVRVSFGYFNTMKDVKKALYAIQQIANKTD